MRREVPAISETQDCYEAVNLCLSEGGVIIRDAVDEIEVGQLKKDLMRIWQHDSVEHWAASELYEPALRRVKFLVKLGAAMESAELDFFNAARCIKFERGASTPTHIDNDPEAEGITALLNLSHQGNISLHGDGWFDIKRLPLRPGAQPSLVAEPLRDGTGEFTERRGIYGPRDVCLLRQTVRHLNLLPKVHSSESVTLLGDPTESREILCFDRLA